MQLQSSSEYSQFKKIVGNRKVQERTVKTLMRSYIDNPELPKISPIIVNDEMQIIDGQHRFEALKRLKREVFYIDIGQYGLGTVQKLNESTTHWKNQDYAESFASLGNRNYQEYIAIKKKYNAPFHLVIATTTGLKDIVNGGSAKYAKSGKNSFKQGGYVITHKEQAIDFFEKRKELMEIYPALKGTKLSGAFYAMWQNIEYEHDRMIKKAKQNPLAIRFDYTNTREALRALEEVYNYGFSEQKGRVRFF